MIGFALAIFLIGWTLIILKVGINIGEKRRLPPPPEAQAMCGCGHHYALHTEEGTCGWTATEHILTERGKPTTKMTGRYGDTHKLVYDHEKYERVEVACPCKRYTGPEPLPRYLP